MPGHMGVEVNKKVYRAANEATERSGTRRCPERFASLAYFRITVSEINWKDAKHCFRREKDRRLPLLRAWYDQVLESQSPDTAAMRETAYVSRT